MDAWIAFARTGNPNHEGLPEWQSYDSEKRATMILGKDCKLENAVQDKERKKNLGWALGSLTIYNSFFFTF